MRELSHGWVRARKFLKYVLFFIPIILAVGVFVNYTGIFNTSDAKDYTASLVSPEYQEKISQLCSNELSANSPHCRYLKTNASWEHRVLVILKNENVNIQNVLAKIIADYKIQEGDGNKKNTTGTISYTLLDSTHAFFEVSTQNDKNRLQKLLRQYKDTIESVTDRKIQITAEPQPLSVKKPKLFSPKDPYMDRQWALAAIEAESAWGEMTNTTNRNVIVAILDSGVDYNHPELTNQIVSGYDFVRNDNIAEDENGHGTAVAGIIAAQTNKKGITGVNPLVKIMPLKVIDKNGNGSLTNLLLAIQYAVDNGASVINISAGFIEKNNDGPLVEVVQSYINYALNKGVVVVASAGNIPVQADELVLPAIADDIISVSSLDRNGEPVLRSNNFQPGLYAPGVSILTLNNLGVQNRLIDVFKTNNLFGYVTGSSGATAVVTGIVSLLVTELPGLSPLYYKAVLENSAQNRNANAYEAMLLLKKSLNPEDSDNKSNAQEPSGAEEMNTQISTQFCAPGHYELISSCTQSTYVDCSKWCQYPNVKSYPYPGCKGGSEYDFDSASGTNTDHCWKPVIVVDAALLEKAIREKELAIALALLVLYSSNLTDDDLQQLIKTVEKIYGISAEQTAGMDRAELLETLVTDVSTEMVDQDYPTLTQNERTLLAEAVTSASLYEIKQRDYNLPQSAFCDGNPVRMSSCTKETTALDLSIPVLSDRFEIKRKHSTFYKDNYSFGKAWFFNYDTRIILGVKKDAEKLLALGRTILNSTTERLETLKAAQADIQSYIDEIDGIYNRLNNNMDLIGSLWSEAESIRQHAKAERNLAITKRNETKTQADKAITHATNSNANGANAVISKARKAIDDANFYMNHAKNNYTKIVNRINTASNSTPDATELLSRLEEIRSSMNGKKATMDTLVNTMQTHVDELSAEVETLQTDAEIARVHMENNRYAVDPENAETQQFGNDYIKWIDENGNNHFFVVNENGTVEPVRAQNYNGINGLELVKNSDETYLLKTLSGSEYRFDKNGLLVSKADDYGTTLRFQYSEPVQIGAGEIKPLKSVQDRFNRKLSFEYTGRNITSITDFTGRIIRYTYNDGFLSSHTDAMGFSIAYEYDVENMIVTKVVDRNGGEKKYEYENISDTPRVVKETDPRGNTWQFDFDPDAKTTEITDRRGFTTTYYSNEAGSTTKIVHPDDSSIEYFYDQKQNRTAQKDENGNITGYVYNEQNQVQKIVLPNNGVITYAYYSSGKVKSITDPQGGKYSYTYNARGKVLTQSGPDGATMRYVYNSTGQPVKVTNSLGHSTVMTYDQFGYIASKRDASGALITMEFDTLGRPIMIIAPDTGEMYYEYDPLNRITSVMDPLGYISSFEYFPDGQISKKVLPLNRVFTYVYDISGNLIRLDEPGGVFVEYEYDEEENLVSQSKNGVETFRAELDSRGRITTSLDGGSSYTTEFFYDRAGNVIKLTDAYDNYYSFVYNSMNQLISAQDRLGSTNHIEYDLNGNRIASIDKLNSKTEYVYDSVNRLVETVDSLGGSMQMQYDLMGNRSRVVDNNGNVTTFRYNNANRLSSVTDSLGARSNYYYDKKGNRVKVVAPNGAETLMQYDLKSRVVAIVDALGQKSVLEYDAADNITHAKNANGELSSVKYDIRNRPILYQDPLGNKVNLQYDNFDNMVRATDPLGSVALFTYDQRNKLIETRKPGGGKNQFSYDRLDRLLEKTDALGRSTNYSYDSEGRLAQVSDALGNSTSYIYDAEGRLLSYTNANDHVTSYTYDSLSRLIRESDALKNSTRFSYDANSNLLQKSLPGGGTISFSYDAKNRLVKKATSDSMVNTYQYDVVDNLVSAQNANYIENYSYDLLKRKIHVNNITHNKSIEYQYDAVGRRTYMSSPKAPGSGTEYRYDRGGNLVGVRFPETPNRENLLQYDAAGRVANKQYVNGVVKNIAYDADGNITRQSETLNGTSIVDFAYEYDKVGNPIRITRETGRTDEMTYDKLNRMTEFVRGAYSMQYRYDAVGNRTQESGYLPANLQTGVSGGPVSIASNYNELNQLVSRGSITYDYDSKGNRVTKTDSRINGPIGAITSYTYNVENQLTNVKLPDAKTYEYKYDALDRRVYKKYAIGPDTFANHIIYDGRQTLYELNEDQSPLAQYNFLPHPSLPYGEPVLRKFYGYKGRGSAGGKAGKQTIGNTHYYHTDALGTTWKMTNHQGQEIFEYDYDPWGNILNNEFTEPYNRFLFTGKEFDYETQLTHIDAREYDMQSATWIQKDPYNLATLQLPQQAQGLVAMLGQKPQGMLMNPADLNGYSYVYNNPARYKDDTGHFIFTAMAIGAGVGLLIEGISQLLSDKEMSVGERLTRLGFSMVAGGLSGVGGFWASAYLRTGFNLLAGATINSGISAGVTTINNNLYDENNNIYLSGLFGFAGGLLGNYGGSKVANWLTKTKLPIPRRFFSPYVNSAGSSYTTYMQSLTAKSHAVALATAEAFTNFSTNGLNPSFWSNMQNKFSALTQSTCAQPEYTSGWTTNYSNVFSSTNSSYENSQREQSQRELSWSYGLQWDYLADGRRTFSVDPSTIVTLYTNPQIEIVNTYHMGY
ncbi:MAG: S8 family serine peptidase [Leptospirales bacterium]